MQLRWFLEKDLWIEMLTMGKNIKKEPLPGAQ